MYDNCVLAMNVVDEDVHGLFFWWKPLCYSSKCIQDKDGTRMVLNSLFFFLFDKKVTLRILCKAKLINKLLVIPLQQTDAFILIVVTSLFYT